MSRPIPSQVQEFPSSNIGIDPNRIFYGNFAGEFNGTLSALGVVARTQGGKPFFIRLKRVAGPQF